LAREQRKTHVRVGTGLDWRSGFLVPSDGSGKLQRLAVRLHFHDSAKLGTQDPGNRFNRPVQQRTEFSCPQRLLAKLRYRPVLLQQHTNVPRSLTGLGIDGRCREQVTRDQNKPPRLGVIGWQGDKLEAECALATPSPREN